MVSFLICDFISNHGPHSSNHDDFLDDTDRGKDLDSINFDNLNRIGEDWEAGGKEVSAGEDVIGGEAAGGEGEPGVGEHRGEGREGRGEHGEWE